MGTVSQGQFDDWLTPREAVRLLEPAYGTGSDSYIAKHTLLENVRAGLVRAVARDSSEAGKKAQLADVKPNHFHAVAENHIFWVNGLVSYRAGSYSEDNEYRFFDVRFDPESVRKIVGSVKADAPAGAPLQAEPGPAVSDAALEAWYETYKANYPDNSLDHAWASARGMFHDKTVTRIRVSKLRGPREMGRPKALDDK